jgi:hypothetical protein
MKTPDHAILIDNYAEFRDDVRALADAKYNFLIVIGRTGVGKTEAVREMVGPHVVFEGRPSAWGFYCQLYEFRHATVLLDDVSPQFYHDPTCQSLLKALTETRATKTLAWHTAAAGSDKAVPRSFETDSRVVVLTNGWETINEHIRAIESRAFIISFDPTPEELHFEVGRRGWFGDQEVYDFVWAHRRFITRPDMRAYRRIAEQKRAGRPWHKRALEMVIGDQRMLQIAKLLDDPRYESNNQRAAAFVEQGLGARSTFYSLLSEFRWYRCVSPDAEPPRLAAADAGPGETASDGRGANPETNNDASAEVACVS